MGMRSASVSEGASAARRSSTGRAVNGNLSSVSRIMARVYQAKEGSPLSLGWLRQFVGRLSLALMGCAVQVRRPERPKGKADALAREDARGRDTNAAKNILARGLALMADLGFCQIAIAGEARAVEAAHTEHRTGQKQWGDSGCRNPLPSCFKQFLRGGCQCYNPPRQHHTQRRACHVGAHIKP